ncbi:MAG TPA: T9SS type A sorting domain-containing protein, partial [Candidatus Cloacimonadota bacterium]|nr:T9SS type A sorting domain-containing protein [Candidatus Cloacimonadota bacterium]
VAYVSDFMNGVQVIDVSNPASPSLIQNIMPHPTSYIYPCSIDGDYLYTSDINWNEIDIFNISNPTQPTLVARYPWNHFSNGITVNNGTLYSADDFYGFSIIDLNSVPIIDPVAVPSTGIYVSNYPNPFNPETSISYTLPTSGQVKISIYNIRGQLVKQLDDSYQASGKHTITWNGMNDNHEQASSGIYFCRITSGGKQVTHKLMMVK